MAFTAIDGRIVFTTNDSVGGWSESTTSYYIGAEEGGLEGAGFVGFDLDIETLYNWEVDVVIPADVTGVHLGAFIRVTNAGDLDTKINGGIALCLRDAAGNESYFYVGGSDTYSGGWVYFVADISGTPDATNGAPADITNALDFGVGGKCLAKSLNDNFQMDIMHYGTSGLSVTGTPDTATYGVGNSIEEIYSIVNANFYGLISKQVGSYVFKGPLVLGGAASLTFNDSDSSIFFEDLPVASDFYKISLDATNPADITFAGFNSQTVGPTAAELDFSAAVTSFSYDASTAIKQGITTFKAGDYDGDKFVQCAGVVANAGANLDNFVSDASGLITLNTTATLTNSTITESTGGISVICEDLARVTNNSIVSDGANHGIELSSIGGGSMTWDNSTSNYDIGVSGSPVTPTATGNEDLFVNVASGTLTVNVAAGATIPSIRSAGAVVNVVAGLLPITVSVKSRITGLPIQNANISMQRADTKSTIIIGTTDATGLYAESVAASFENVDYVVWARQSDLLDDDYVSQTQTGSISSTGANVNFNLELQD